MRVEPDGPGVRISPVVVGRDEVLSLAARRWQAAAGGAGHVLLLAGEAGIGKTRVLREVSAQVRAGGGVVVGAIAGPLDAETAGAVLIDLAGQARRAADPAVVAAGGAMTARLRAFDEQPGRLLEADLAGAILALAGGSAPVLLALEDLHHVDDLSLRVLSRVARQVRGLPMLVLGSYRSDELYPQRAVRQWRAGLVNQRLAEEVRVRRLTRDETATLSAAIVGAVVPTALVDLVYRRSDGIPLHVEELLATASEPAGATPRVPETLAEAVLTQAGTWSTTARELADAAAVIGRSFDLELLTAVSGVGPATVDSGLRELLERHVVLAGRDEATYDFRHALIRDALYADLTPHRRRDLHARVAVAAEAAGMRSAFVSDQYERAQQPAPAYRHARLAAAEAARLSAHREAVDLLHRAQRTMPTSTPEPERADVLARLAATLAATDDNAGAATTYAEAHQLFLAQDDPVAAAALVPAWVAVRHLLGADLAERTGRLRAALDQLSTVADQESTLDTRIQILAALAAAYMLARRLDEALGYGEQAKALIHDQTAELLHVDSSVGSVLVFAGQMEAGWELLETAIVRAVRERIEAEAARGYRMIGSSASVLVEYDRAERWLTEGIAYASRTERWNDRHYMSAHLAHVQWARGDWDAAGERAGQALADGHDGITTRLTALHVLGYLALGRGELAGAGEQLDQARRLAEPMDEVQRLAPALWGLAEVSVLRGQFQTAVDWCERGYAGSAEVADAAYLFPFLVTGVRGYLGLAALERAKDWFARCAELLRRRRIPGTLPALDHALGLLDHAEGHTAKARDALQAAVDGWSARQRFWEGNWARLDLARSTIRSRRPADATRLVATVRERAAAVGALALIEAAEAMPAAAVTDDAPLSVREHEVARLIASGGTNREIATTLHIAPKTVAAHVEHILTKLGAARRAEIAAWIATRSGR